MGSEPLAAILAVLVSYGMSPGSSITLQSLAVCLSEADASLDLLIFDNSPESSSTDLPMLPKQFRATYHHDHANPGISAAFNAGAALARSKGKEWLLLLDQDSAFPPEAMTVYLKAVASGGAALFAPRLTAGGRLLSPCGYRAGIGYHLHAVDPGSMSLEGRALLNSGILVRLDAFDKSGGYDEQVRVDFADFAFINRFRRHYKDVVVLDLVCQHGFSNMETVPVAAALSRFSGYCRDGRAAAVTPLLWFSHAFLVLRRCMVLMRRYRALAFLALLKNYFSPGQRTAGV